MPETRAGWATVDRFPIHRGRVELFDHTVVFPMVRKLTTKPGA